MNENDKLNVLLVGEKLDRFSEVTKALDDTYNFYLVDEKNCLCSVVPSDKELALILFQKRIINNFCLCCIKKVKWLFPQIRICVLCEKVTKNVSTLLFKYGIMDIFESPLGKELKPEVIVPMFDYLYKMKENSKEVYNYLLLKDANETPITTPPPDERIQRAKNYIKINYTRSISLETVSSIACVSKYHFCKIFKNNEGASFKEYVTGLRIKKAAELLMNSNISVAEVAYNVGFSSQSHFTALFRSWIKITPGEFRKKSF